MEDIPSDALIEVWLVNTNAGRMRSYSFVQDGPIELAQNESAMVWKGSLNSLRMRGIPIHLTPIHAASPFDAKDISLVIKANRPLNLDPGKLEILKTYADGM